MSILPEAYNFLTVKYVFIMNYWHAILKDMQKEKLAHKKTCLRQNTASQEHEKEKLNEAIARCTKRIQYPIAGVQKNMYLTEREAQCIYHLMHGGTLKSTAHKLNLSPRTVEFYINNIKDRIGIRKKKDLIHNIEQSDFLKLYTQEQEKHLPTKH